MENSWEWGIPVIPRFELDCSELTYDIVSSRELLCQSNYFKYQCEL